MSLSAAVVLEALQPETEVRYFVWQGKAYAPQGSTNGPIPELVKACCERIASPFFSVDVALNAEGQERIVEIGDGQVSDLVGWEPEAFAGIFS